MRRDIQAGLCVPEGFFLHGIIEGGASRRPRRYMLVRLPVWKMKVSVYWGQPMWHRLVVVYVRHVQGCRQFDGPNEGWHCYWEAVPE